VYSPNFPLPRLLLIFGSQNYQIYFIFLRVQNFEGTLSKHWQVKKKNYIFLHILNQNLAAVNCTVFGWASVGIAFVGDGGGELVKKIFV